MRLRFDKLEAHLEDIGRKEREARKVFTTLVSQPQQRRSTLEQLNSIAIHVQGAALAAALLSNDPSKEQYFLDFYDQARSKNGITKDEQGAVVQE